MKTQKIGQRYTHRIYPKNTVLMNLKKKKYENISFKCFVSNDSTMWKSIGFTERGLIVLKGPPISKRILPIPEILPQDKSGRNFPIGVFPRIKLIANVSTKFGLFGVTQENLFIVFLVPFLNIKIITIICINPNSAKMEFAINGKSYMKKSKSMK